MKNALLLLLTLCLSLELASFAASFFLPELFYRPAQLNAALTTKVTPESLQYFLSHRYIPGIGWRFVAPSLPNCQNQPIAYAYDSHGDRLFPGYDHDSAEILLTGDSYIFGMELPAADTIAAKLSQSGMKPANLGVPGMSPLQMYLYAKARRPEFPHAKIVVMSIMTENIHRLVNSHWAVYASDTSFPFNMRPYMKNGQIIPLPENTYATPATVIDATRSAYQSDYWAPTLARFPYSFSLAQALASPRFKTQWRMFWNARRNHEFHDEYTDSNLSENLLKLLVLFSNWAATEKLVPVVIFLPMDSYDTTSPGAWIEQNKTRLPTNLIIKNSDFNGIDPTRYNLPSPVPGIRAYCHPSAYGAAALASQFTAILAPLLRPAHE